MKISRDRLLAIIRPCFFVVLCLWIVQSSATNTPIIAVATNFLLTAEKLGESFNQRSGKEISFVAGSSGQLFAKIKHGAPYDAFFSADHIRAVETVKHGFAEESTLVTYAKGQLAFITSRKNSRDEGPEKILREQLFDKLAIANPRLAPYGLAAMQVLSHLKLDKKEIVTAENVGQAFAFVDTGNADAGLVALSSVLARKVAKDSYYVIPAEMHDPIRQDAVVLKNGKNVKVASAFLEFVQSPNAKSILAKDGYLVD